MGMVQAATVCFQPPVQGVEPIHPQHCEQAVGIIQLDQHQAQRAAGLAASGHGRAQAAEQAGIGLRGGFCIAGPHSMRAASGGSGRGNCRTSR